MFSINIHASITGVTNRPVHVAGRKINVDSFA